MMSLPSEPPIASKALVAPVSARQSLALLHPLRSDLHKGREDIFENAPASCPDLDGCRHAGLQRNVGSVDADQSRLRLESHRGHQVLGTLRSAGLRALRRLGAVLFGLVGLGLRDGVTRDACYPRIDRAVA